MPPGPRDCLACLRENRIPLGPWALEGGDLALLSWKHSVSLLQPSTEHAAYEEAGTPVSSRPGSLFKGELAVLACPHRAEGTAGTLMPLTLPLPAMLTGPGWAPDAGAPDPWLSQTRAPCGLA